MRMGEALEWCCEELGNRARDGSLALSVGDNVVMALALTLALAVGSAGWIRWQ